MKQFIIALFLIIIHLITLCFTFIEWGWNTSALIRIVAPFLLFGFLHPAVAMLLIDGILDGIEPNISRENIGYHVRDKKLDVWAQLVGTGVLWLVPSMKPYRIILTGLFIFRSIGVASFLKTKNKKFLAYFPNYYSLLYILLPFLDHASIVVPTLKIHRFTIVSLALIIKTIVEYYHHYSDTSKKIKKLRNYTRIFCKGKVEMYKKTGTYPVDKQRLNEETPVFKM